MIGLSEESWREILAPEMEKAYFKELMHYLASERKSFAGSVFPAENEVFRAFNSCGFHDVKVVILGQDPYPTAGHAHGLSFSVDASVKPLPRSLNNIYNELQSDTGCLPAENGDLTRWANQGVLLLNTVLTVREGIPNSHAKKGWEKFTDEVIRLLNEKRTEMVYMLWGRNAHQKAESVSNTHNLILKTSHPSPLGYTKSGKDFEAFKGSKVFSRANAYLEEHGHAAIEW